MNTINNTVLLLTGCINPNGMPQTVLQDPQARKEQYKVAIEFYATNTQLPIVFVENTNTDLGSEFIEETSVKRIEFITFDGNNYDHTRGKGYGEAIMMEYAINNSTIINSHSYIIKITGRLIIENVNCLLKEMVSPKCVYANLVRGNCGLERKSFFWGAPYSFLKFFFLSHKDEIDESDNVYFERHLYNECLEWAANDGLIEEFKLPILVQGISGSTGRIYPREKYPYIKAMLRYYLHKLPFYNKL